MRVTEPYTIFPRTLASGRVVYYYQFRDELGRRTNARSTGCTSMSAARRYCQRLYNGGELKKDAAVRLRDFADGFFAEGGGYRRWRAANGRPLKPETVRRYELSLDKHILPFFKDVPLKKVTRGLCKEWVLWAGERWTAKSVNNAQGVLNLILEAAVEQGAIPSNPLHGLGLRRTVKKQRVLLSVEELRALYAMEWPDEPERAAFLLAAVTGMRIGEALGLKRADLLEGCVNVERDVSDRFGEQSGTKTGLKRRVPVPEGFPFPPGEPWVFGGAEPMRSHKVYNAFTRRCDMLGIRRRERGIDLHSLRDFFVTYLRTANVPDPKIRAVVGHADETMTDVYTHWRPEMFPEVYAAQEKLYRAITGGEELR